MEVNLWSYYTSTAVHLGGKGGPYFIDLWKFLPKKKTIRVLSIGNNNNIHTLIRL